jgi:hypothetical protein
MNDNAGKGCGGTSANKRLEGLCDRTRIICDSCGHFTVPFDACLKKCRRAVFVWPMNEDRNDHVPSKVHHVRKYGNTIRAFLQLPTEERNFDLYELD